MSIVTSAIIWSGMSLVLASPNVVWHSTGKADVALAKRQVYEARAFQECARLGVEVGPDVSVDARRNTDAGPYPLTKIEFRFSLGTKPVCRLAFFEADVPRLATFCNLLAQETMWRDGDGRYDAASLRWQREPAEARSGEFASYIKRNLKKEHVRARAENVLSKIADIDRRKWQYTACCYLRGGWHLVYTAKVGQYLATGYRIHLTIADVDSMDLVYFTQNAHTWPKPRNLKMVVSADEAKKLGDQYLRKYYHRDELNTLVFLTNRLEVLTPNYAFMPQRHETTDKPKKPTLTWVSLFERKKDAAARTPVYIFVDAEDGSMLGGYE